MTGCAATPASRSARLSPDVYAAYLRWCRVNGESRPRPSNHFAGALERLGGWYKKRVEVYDNTDYMGTPTVKAVIFPPDNALQAAGTAPTEGHSLRRYVTQMVCRFADSLKDGATWRAAA